MNVLAVGPHPDDCEYGCFGTLARHIESGDRVHIVIVAYGEHGLDPSVRIKEAETSKETLGADSIDFLGFKIWDVSTISPHIIDPISAAIKRHKPDTVYVCSPFDTHQNHQTVSHCTVIAGRYVDRLLFYETPSSTGEFNPSYWVDITPFFDVKIKCLEAYKSQLVKRPYLRRDPVESLNQYRYTQGKFDQEKKGYAEAYSLYRRVIR